MKKYKYKAVSLHNKVHYKWMNCTERVKQSIEAQHPNKFIFELNEKPAPTPSMQKKENPPKK